MRRLLIIICLASVILLAGCYRSEQTGTLTVGVIMVNDAASYGWGDLLAGGAEYVATTVQGQRVILYDNLNAIDKPAMTLEVVVGGMVERGARVIFVSSAHLTGPDERKVDELYPNTIFIMNVTTRADIATLLGALPSVASDIDRVTDSAGEPAAAAPATMPAAVDTGSTRDTLSLVGFFFICGLVAVLLLFFWVKLNEGSSDPVSRGKSKKRHISSSVNATGIALEAAARPHMTDFRDAPPLVHKLSTFVSGDSHFDESFSVELPSHEFLGECGFGISAPLNRYEKDKITALEVWLFDKDNVHTANAVLISEHALSNRAQRVKLASKGTLVEAAPGALLELATNTLRVEARVLDFQYGYSDQHPARSFFDHVVLEIAVWQK